MFKQQEIRPKKGLSQNFLLDKKVVSQIIESCEIIPTDIILEVGAGFGELTQFLIKKAYKVLAVEKDPFLFNTLNQTFRDAKNLVLFNQDILKLNFKDIVGTKKLKLVSNLPYSITSDFLYWLLDNRRYIKSCILTLQKEVAQKLLAKSGTKVYGALSVIFQFYMEIKPLFLISGKSFFPTSKVTSEVIYLRPKRKRTKVNEELFLKIVKTAFANRRKQLKNSLSALGGLKTKTFGKIDLSQRPENLSYQDFLRLTNSL
ncbi:ribosomal RNA small subunit methyltransferase A [candidate division WOR-3 bacterium]|nr:ribosomal RNA small subunit methyltransferase A [candidate division WOR-3 bacterium]